MNREEHVLWCQERALEYVELGKFDQAVRSMSSDIQKHEPRVKADFDLIVAGTRMIVGHHTEQDVRAWIARFN